MSASCCLDPHSSQTTFQKTELRLERELLLVFVLTRFLNDTFGGRVQNYARVNKQKMDFYSYTMLNTLSVYQVFTVDTFIPHTLGSVGSLLSE